MSKKETITSLKNTLIEKIIINKRKQIQFDYFKKISQLQAQQIVYYNFLINLLQLKK